MNKTFYTEVRSNYIRNLIQQTNWNAENGRKCVDSLIKLEHYILHGVSNYIAGMHYTSLKDEHRKEWKLICGELNPKKLRKELKWEEERRKHYEAFNRKQRKEQEEMRKDWRKAGGKV